LKLPRDLSGDDLVRLLGQFGYQVSRQTGSHLRLTSKRTGVEHHLTVPMHKQLRVGTLAEILGDVASYLGLSRDELARRLFG